MLSPWQQMIRHRFDPRLQSLSRQLGNKSAAEQRLGQIAIMPDYKALCSDCPKCGKENIVFLAHKFRTIGVNDTNMKRITCTHCFHVYEQRIEEMVLRPKTEAEINAAGGMGALAYI